MGIVRYENLSINNVVNGVNSLGEYTTTTNKWFDTRGLVHDIANSLRITERYRAYSDLLQVTLNYTPNIKRVVDAILKVHGPLSNLENFPPSCLLVASRPLGVNPNSFMRTIARLSAL